MFRQALRGFVLVLCCWYPANCVSADRLVIDYMISSGEQRTIWVNRIIRRFSAENPDISVSNREYRENIYKDDFLAHLKNEKVDLAFWFAGKRLRDAVELNLLSPLDKDQVDFLLNQGFAEGSLNATRINGKIYGFPLSYYPWGFFYRKSVFQNMGLAPPKTWNDFLAVCGKLKAANVAPLAVGAKDGWPAAAWFDYLDLRINGMRFHRRLLLGEESFRDPRVHKVFNEWRELLKNDFFLKATMNKEWDSVLPFLYRKEVGMVLMGAFAAAKFPDQLTADIGFFPFPRYAADVPNYEDVPVDVLVLPSKGGNHQATRRFLNFLATTGALYQLNEMQHTISPQAVATDRGQRPGWAILNGASETAFFFDRDAKAQLVRPAFDAFKQFLKAPYDSDQAIRYIDEHSRP